MTYQHKRSSIVGKIPTVADFGNDKGQLLINTSDGKIYMLVNGAVKAFKNTDDLSSADVGLGNVANKSEAQMAASGDIANALGGKLDKTATAADSAKFGNQTVAQWDAKIAAAGNWPGVYKGNDDREVNLPIGSYISVRGTAAGAGDLKTLNSTHVVRVDTNFTPTSYYTFGGTGLVLSGTWTACGLSGATPSTNWPCTTMKRTA